MEERFIGNANIFSEEEKKLVYKGYREEKTPRKITKAMFAKAKNYDEVSKMQYIDMMTWLRGDILVKDLVMSIKKEA